MAAAASNFGDDTYSLLLAQLECPVCLNRGSKPIFMCPNGHNVCNKCQPNLTSCPVCRVAGRPTNRNLFAEEFLLNELVPCKNAEQGCKKVFKLKEMPEHLQVCDFGFKCMFEDCSWRGTVAALSEHARSLHSKHVFPVDKDGVKLLNDDFDGVCTKCGEDCGRPILRTAMLIFDEKYFWFISEQTVDWFKVQISLISKANEKPSYNYMLIFQSTDSCGINFTSCNKVRALMSGSLGDAVFEDADHMKRYLHGIALPFVLKMAVEFSEDKATHFKTPSSGFNPQLRHKSLPHWEHLEYIDLGGGSNDRQLTKDEFAKYYQFTDYERNNVLFHGIFLVKGYKDYLHHSS